MLSHLLLTAATAEEALFGIGDAALAALTGYGVVFSGIVVLMGIIALTGRIVQPSRKKDLKEVSAPAAKSAADAPVAPGSAGQLKLYDTDPKTAAMIMAIVADKMGKPINELRFISIKEVQ